MGKRALPLFANGPTAPASKALKIHRPSHLLSSRESPKRPFNYNPEIFFDEAPDPEHAAYTRVTSNDLERHTKPPTRVKMLATIFTSAGDPINFRAMRDSVEFQNEVARRYSAYGRQIWHTPTELFKYLLKYFPYEDLVIYEIGAGNGTAYPEVYERTHYNIVEISGRLAKLQEELLVPRHGCVRISHKSIFHWDQPEPAPCFFLAMEVIDNFAHDMIRYDYRSLEPYQALITVNANGDYGIYYTRLAARAIPGVNAPVVQARVRGSAVACSTLFVRPGLFDIFFPTQFSRLRDMYEHVLAQPSADDDRLPIAPSPLASSASPLSIGADFFSSYQPRNRRTPTDGVASASGLPVGERKSNVFTHAMFMETYADLESTCLQNGENPLVDYYKNVKFLF
ncbi:S-adenosyl-L-methionine-dependent methyltransferase [Russula vinacea]|nr:S-adenosyl-L-methionine-dependent methyltransferase [Russula vinacea]